MAIKYRTAGPWGAGSPSNLSPAEVDENFFTLDQRVETLENDPPEAISIDHFVVEGTLLTIVTTDAVEHGPFVLPVAQWRWTGEWLPNTQYFVGDIIENDGSLYFVRVQHVSAATFDPDLFTIDGQVYILMISKAAQPYDMGMFFNDTVQPGVGNMFTHIAVRSFTIPLAFAGSQAWLSVATSTSPITVPIYRDESEIIGLIHFIPGIAVIGDGQLGAFEMIGTEPIDIVAQNRISIGEPYELDETASGLAVTIVGTTPAV